MQLVDRGKYKRPSWTNDTIMAALHCFYQEYGTWPTTFDFHPRVRPIYLPHLSTIWRHFGGLDLACHATEIAFKLPGHVDTNEQKIS